MLTWREPHGVTGHIIPWNYPMQIFGRSVGGALAAGNACVVKPAEDACLSLLRIAELAGARPACPTGALNVVTGLGHEAGAALAAHPGIDHLSFTGSPATGALVAQAAAQRHCPVTLELGGKSPQIVFADADLDAALPVLVNAIVQNAGQTCSAGSRLLVERRATKKLLANARRRASRRCGSGPHSTDLDCGPLIRAAQLERVDGFLGRRHARRHCRRCAAGPVGADAPAGGYYVAPTLLRDVPPSIALAREEVFGPVLAAMPFDDEADAVAARQRAPTSAWSPASGPATAGASCAWRARCAAARCSSTTTAPAAASSCRSAAYGHSGYGREKGFEALHGFTTLKTVVLQHG